jgi:hypothetical protein
MQPNHAIPLKSLLHPYVFLLKEGSKISKDYLDYSLMIVFVHSREKIGSPLTPPLHISEKNSH